MTGRIAGRRSEDAAADKRSWLVREREKVTAEWLEASASGDSDTAMQKFVFARSLDAAIDALDAARAGSEASPAPTPKKPDATEPERSPPYKRIERPDDGISADDYARATGFPFSRGVHDFKAIGAVAFVVFLAYVFIR